MTNLEAALLEVEDLLKALGLPHMLIGGMAVALWGEPRMTLDIDVTLSVGESEIESTVVKLVASLRCRTAAPIDFVRRTRVLPLLASNGVPVDLLFAGWPMETEAIRNSVDLEVGGTTVRLAPLQHLLFLKLISERPKDLADAEALITRHKGSVDLSRLESDLAALAESSGQPEIVERLRRILAR